MEIALRQEDIIRLNRYIAHSGICSRREADKLIAAGDIMVNNVVITQMGHKVHVKNDQIHFRGKSIQFQKKRYLLLNKPKGYITTVKDSKGRKTVMELIKDNHEERIYPIGRLDRDTTGLLLFTNDGDLAKRLSHPSGRVKKIYSAKLDRPIMKTDYEKIKKGFELEDGPVFFDGIVIISEDCTSIGIEVHSGRNRIIHRAFEHLRYKLLKLDRTVYGNLTKRKLPRGKWRYLNSPELRQLSTIS